MTTDLLINTHCLSSLVTHESWVNFDYYLSFTLSRLVSGNLGRWVWASTLRVYKVFTKTGRGPWLRGDLPWAHQCAPLSALSFWVSLFPGTRGYNISNGTAKIFLQGKEEISVIFVSNGTLWHILHRISGRWQFHIKYRKVFLDSGYRGSQPWQIFTGQLGHPILRICVSILVETM